MRPPAGSPRVPVTRLLPIAVAVVYTALALGDGGFSAEVNAAATIAVWWTVIVWLVVGARDGGSLPGAAVLAGAALAGLAALTALSVAWSSDDGRVTVEAVRVIGYLGLFVLVVLASPRLGARTWLGGLALGLVAVSILALSVRIAPSLPGGDEELVAALPGERGRLSYPIGYWNGLAACVALAVPLLGWLGAQASDRVLRALAIAALPLPGLVIYLSSSRGGLIAALAGAAALLALGPSRIRLLSGLALGALGSGALILVAREQPDLVDGLATAAAERQGAALGVAVLVTVVVIGVVHYLAEARIGRLAIPRPPARAIAVGVGILAIVGVIAIDPAERFEEFKEPPAVGEDRGGLRANTVSAAGSGRYQFWTAAADAFSSEPLRGVGAGGFGTWWDQHGTLPLSVRDAHSLFVEVVAELGIAGIALLLAFLVTGAVAGLSRRPLDRRLGGAVGAALAILVAGITSAAIDWTWELPAVFAPVIVAVALLTGPATARAGEAAAGPSGGGSGSEPAGPGGDPGGSLNRFGLGVTTLLAGWVAILLAGIVFVTELKLGDSREAVDHDDLPAAAQDARDAAEVQPWAAEPRLQLALVEELGGDPAAAREAIREAIDRAPEDWSLWAIAARIEDGAGNEEAAREARERAHQLNPRAALDDLIPGAS